MFSYAVGFFFIDLMFFVSSFSVFKNGCSFGDSSFVLVVDFFFVFHEAFVILSAFIKALGEEAAFYFQGEAGKTA